jgi:hypothetical protein
MILAILLFVAFGSAVAAVAHSQNRHVSRGAGRGRSATRGRAGKSGTGRAAGRGSWLLRAWNASGAPKTSETTLGGAAAIATGKAAGAVTRGGWLVSKKTGRAGRWFASRTLVPFDKWLAKKKAGLENAAGMPERPATKECPIPDEPIGGAAARGTKPASAGTPPPVFVNPTKKSSKGEPVSGSTISGAVPATLAPHLNYINDFEPDSDAELLNFMGAEIAGKAGEAEAYQELFERCVSGRGLDPASMQGVSDYAELLAEVSQAMVNARKRFEAIYDAVIEAANNGTVMPHDGRFFSGESAA